MLKHVGILDDSSEFQQLAYVMLDYLGVSTISQWTSSDDALPVLRVAPPDLLLLDVMMAGLSGLEIWDRLRGQGTTAQLPIIVCTAAINRIVDDEIRLANDPHTRILPKPFTLEELRQTLDELMPRWAV